jgi:hypothetical protein
MQWKPPFEQQVSGVKAELASDKFWPSVGSPDPFFALELSGCYFQDLPFKRLL